MVMTSGPSLSRRQMLCGAAALAVPASSCSAAPAGAGLRPEQFGAVGDGRNDDYDAFQRMAAAVNQARGGRIELRPGATYFLNRYVTADNGVADIIFRGCSALDIRGNSASIAVKGDFFREVRATRGLSGLRLEECDNVEVRDLQLIGNVQRTTRPPTLGEAATHGLMFAGCSNVTVEGVLARHFAGDGLYIRESTRPDGSGRYKACRNVAVRRSKFLFNARQGLSIIQLRGGSFESCEFSHSGYVAPDGVNGPYGAHSPGAGVDVEPHATPTAGRLVDVMTGDILFRDCDMIGNAGSAFVAAKYEAGQRFMERVTLDACRLECDDGTAAGQDGFIFDVPGGAVRNCTLRMRDKTAYLGWYPTSDASPHFEGNSVYGRNPRRNRPLFACRPTGGAPVIARNRFIGEHRTKEASGAWLVYIDNPNAIVRGNSTFVPAEVLAGGSPAALVPVFYARAALMEGNIYETDADSAHATAAIAYAPGTRRSNEAYRSPRIRAVDRRP
jgi:hypothetical protein